MSNDPRGSLWRKWDLHVHAPGTTFNNQYKGNDQIDRFLKLIAASDVSAVGVTDYFRLNKFFDCRERLRELKLDHEVVLFPNLELRLHDVINAKGKNVHAHVIFRPDLTEADASTFLAKLTTTYEEGGKKFACGELETVAQCDSAMVTKEAIVEAIAGTFGDGANENAILLAAAGNDGFRPPPGSRRRGHHSDLVDRAVSAVFGNPSNRDYFLTPLRGANKSWIAPKPVFAGSDAHSFEHLEQWLGKDAEEESGRKYATWIKADITFEGLLQTLAEPAERVSLGENQPDVKLAFHVIDEIRFSGVSDFPASIPINPNLASIIGPRSSGKSALLAYAAHAVDPRYAVERQMEADSSVKAKEDAGPAASKTWSDVADISCSVVWADPDAQNGRVVYVPQNSLFQIGGRPEEVTRRIRPALFRKHGDVEMAFSRCDAVLRRTTGEITSLIDEWFASHDELEDFLDAERNIGDPKALDRERLRIQKRQKRLEAKTAMTKPERAAHAKAVKQISESQERAEDIDEILEEIAVFFPDGEDCVAEDVSVRIATAPDAGELPEELANIWQGFVVAADDALAKKLARAVNDHRSGLKTERAKLAKSVEALTKRHSALLAKGVGESGSEELVATIQELDRAIESAARVSRRLVAVRERIATSEKAIETSIRLQTEAIEAFRSAFEKRERTLDDSLGIVVQSEAERFPEDLDNLADRFNRRDQGSYISARKVEIERIRDEPSKFLESLRSGDQRLRKGESPIATAQEALTLHPQIRFAAEMDGDRIGGFQRSSMTPGKQALFALVMILGESEEPWPLLIDQPEDDLDSRSIYAVLVPYLLELKQTRQILMVSHNANLVVGADSEQVIVANRHGKERENRKGQAFDYLTGALENSNVRTESDFILETCGIREHACQLLDGGEVAFEKRRQKYHISEPSH